VQEAPSQPTTQRRRSERVTESLPIIVRGVDLLGQPFEERTATLAFNLHGCRYPSRYHLPKNTWVTIEVTRGSKPRNVRARVAWVQRPSSWKAREISGNKTRLPPVGLRPKRL
jgi:hypothetical protein